jgi:hypothetical protein
VAQQSTANTGVLTIDSLTASVTNSQIKLYVRNSGGVDLVLDKVYFSGTAVANDTALTSKTDKLAIQSTAYFQFKMPSLQTHTFYDVKVVCADGTTVSTSVQAD